MKHQLTKRLIALLLPAVLLLPARGFAIAPSVSVPDYDTGTLLVKLRRSEISLYSASAPLPGCAEQSYLFTAKSTAGGGSGRRMARAASNSGDWYLMELEPGTDPLTVAEELADDPRVMDTMLNYKLVTYENTTAADWTSAAQWYLNESQLPEARVYLAEKGYEPGGSREVVVAVLDTGVDYEHPELQDCIWQNPGETLNGKDDDGNGYVDDIRGWNFADDRTTGGNNEVMDDGQLVVLEDGTSKILCHGTMCAGVIASANNGGGTTGVAYGVTIMPVKIIGRNGAYVSDMIRGIVYACENGADIVNMSNGLAVGGYSGVSASDKWVKALAEAVELYQDSTLFIAAAGNKDATEKQYANPSGRAWPNAPTTGYPYYCETYPAALDGVIGVMAYNEAPTKDGDRLRANSRWDSAPGESPEYEIMAPGAEILTTGHDPSTGAHNYEIMSGTSFSAPYVSGLAALLMSYYRGTACDDPAMIRRLLLETAEPMQAYTNTYASPEKVYAYPVAQLAAAMTYTTLDLDGDGTVTGAQGDTIRLHEAMYAVKGEENFLPIADYNDDEVINVKDQMYFLRMSALESQ